MGIITTSIVIQDRGRGRDRGEGITTTMSTAAAVGVGLDQDIIRIIGMARMVAHIIGRGRTVDGTHSWARELVVLLEMQYYLACE
jgi:hypothetical protein